MEDRRTYEEGRWSSSDRVMTLTFCEGRKGAEISSSCFRVDEQDDPPSWTVAAIAALESYGYSILDPNVSGGVAMASHILATFGDQHR